MINNNIRDHKRGNSLLKLSNLFVSNNQYWQGSLNTISFDGNGIKAKLLNLDKPCYIIRVEDKIGVSNEGESLHSHNGKIGQAELLMSVPAMQIQQLGDPNFLDFHNVKYAYTAGAMAHGIASEELVIALGKEKILSSFGAGGLSLDRVEAAINRIQQALPQGPYAFNLLHSPSDPVVERGVIDLYLKYQVRTIEASAFLDLTENIVYYRVAGLGLNAANQIEIKNKVIAKISRREVATKFLQPAPFKILKNLVQQGLISELQATLAAKIPMADDITVEADSGGHTDNRPLVCLLPSILELRDQIQGQYGYERPVRIGVAGGIATPQSALAAFMMGAAYVVTGSINQSCIEAGTSQYTKQLLAQAEMADVMMAPAADMFEMGVKLQVLKRGTLFPLRAQKLFDLYKNYDSIEDIPFAEREKLEKQVFKTNLDVIWQETVNYLSQRNPDKLHKAANNPKLKMALIFRWYLGLSSRWSNSGEKGREIDYQIWCGPAMGSFNNWIKGSYLADLNNRRVLDVANQIMTGVVFLYRMQVLKIQGLEMPTYYSTYHPVHFN
ncbi:PfaD family polyunsaturated fatty acid/polyketide biosynthesis protein [Nodularia spumigena CS-584]|jgi:trans-AT polyketide synthase, acyltransferase and oxidoreductase domains|uniref:Polyketide biosynthesis protein PksE n=2 Tax=Nodularia spumigena TaxID=70799 RepID=A0A2S0Q6Q7_NODSP|nr:PfaD family polyunsaturated fatty acid/polyketide biosynthesis protein [Nodularia spumigena]AHJ27703.1 Enoyl-[acyl-carrier-protein] reductase [FMN], inferred for PFA pathway [Nodularia spumigena CCY9414]AVZ30103.1 polyketide biosynthesis protein PksE [Nodularia spumigena UHCC 0039]EAW46442.1 2-nitropropane dioxygenase, NPD [Nodularia spumigena CCY9414]MDB9383834.1 PfaD family polyunsaturated fatty acid/polyketide biosynthesis protein [Nodularia spumigena CS-584]MEA5523756.1 PfaD family poly